MATVLAVRSEVTGKRPIKLTPKMQGAGGLGTRLSGGVKKRKAVGGRLITKARKDGASEHVDDNDDVDDVAGNTGIDNASAAAADPSSGAGDAAPLGVQVHADDFSDEEHDEEEERTKLQTEKQVLTVTLISCAAGDGRQDTLNNITERDGASLPSQSPAGSPLEGVAAASDQAANGRLAELERTTQQQSQLISSLLLQLNNGSCSLERGAVEKGGLLIWHFAEGTMRPFGTALFDIIVRNAFQKGAGGSATVVKAYHIAYLLYLSPFEFSLGESGGSLQLAVMSGTIKWPHPPLSASSFPSPNLPSFLLLPIFPPPPPLPLLPALFPRPFLPIPSRLFSSPFPNPRYGQSRFEFSLGESGGMVQLAVMGGTIKWPHPPLPASSAIP
ncbi:unnamed protein product [Closterium sp. NIES-65]|nr:unnamed protein product [Closterium sp. NIES-65]